MTANKSIPLVLLFLGAAGAHAQQPIGNAAPAVTATIPAASAAAVPPLVTYSGAALEPSGKPLSSPSSITFLIFKESAGGEPLFTETQGVALDTTGHYKVTLGATLSQGLPAELFSTGEARWLEVQIAGEQPQPRVLLVSVPYALKAADAETLGGLPASAFALAGAKSSAAALFPAGITPDAVTNVTTTGGASGYVPVFNGLNTIIDSPVFVNGTNVGIGTTTPSEPLDVNGATALRGNVSLYYAGGATAAAGANSHSFSFEAASYDSSTAKAIRPFFSLLAEAAGNNTATPSATFNFQYSNGTTLAETGLYLNSNGTFHFAPAQTFPGADITGVVNASGYNLGGSSFATGSASSGNSFVGFSGNSSTTGVSDVGVGSASLSDVTTGNGNVAEGAFALHNDTTGSYNSAVGYGAAYFNTVANFNAALGVDALYFNTGSDNTGVGTDALFENTTGSNNTGLGYGAGPDSSSGALTSATAIGYSSTVSQSNSLILGQTTPGSPGNTFVNVGVGTAKPRSAVEVAVNVENALGPTLTLTNATSSSNPGLASIDFNTYIPSTSGTYNPSSRIEADGDGVSDALLFLSNNENTAAVGPNNGLSVNMEIGGNGRINIGNQDLDINDYAEQLVVTSVSEQGDDEVAAIGAFGASTSLGYGSRGIYSIGGDGVGNAQADWGGDGAYFQGGYTPESSSGAAGYGIYAEGGVGGVGVAAYAGYFSGNIEVTGTVYGSAKDFRIDHPLDPANEYLNHASVESSEQMNIYTGNVTTDELGVATVQLPDWFEAENADFRYQLTVVDGRFAQAVVSREIANHQFTISTNATKVKVSWQVTAVRQDAYAKAHPLTVEEAKPQAERGFYMHPELFGQPSDKQSEWGRRPAQMQKLQALREKQKLMAQRSTSGRPLTTHHEQPASAVGRQFPARQFPATPLGGPKATAAPASTKQVAEMH